MAEQNPSTKPEEQAVSIATLIPVRSRKYEKREAMTAFDDAVIGAPSAAKRW